MSSNVDQQMSVTDRSPAPPTPLQSIARGSAWTIAARWSARIVGLVSTIILARLLQPTDFGIIAMAMVTIQFLNVFTEAGQELAVIRQSNATAEHFDTAWTMSVCAGAIVALGLLLVAPLAGWFFDEPRLPPVIRLLALAPLIQGFTNIGATAGFQRDLAFNKDFRFTVIRKLSTFIVTIPLAFVWQNYWALVIGILGGRVITVLASYFMHPYRPRLRLPKIREIWSFSAWTQVSEIGNFLGNQTDQIIVGNIAGSAGMGAYNVAEDLAAAPTGELVVPAARAIFPVYATLLQDPAELARSYLSVLSVIAIVALSTGVGVALVADDLVAVVLGPKWNLAAALIPWLAVSAGLFGVTRSINAVLNVTGNARLNAMRIWAFAALLIPAAIIAGLGWGAEGVAAARMSVVILFIPIMFYSLMWVIPVTTAQIAECLWRPACASLSMAALIWYFEPLPVSPVSLRLFCTIGLGAVVFTTTLLGLWFMAGRPAGAERTLIMQALRIRRHATPERVSDADPTRTVAPVRDKMGYANHDACVHNRAVRTEEPEADPDVGEARKLPARSRSRIVVGLLIPVSTKTEFQPIRRNSFARLRNHLRRKFDSLKLFSGLPMRLHYSAWLDYENTNRGDIAIRVASRQLIASAFGGNVEFIEISWDEVQQIEASWINERADLFVIGGGGYYFLDASGRLSPRVARDLNFLRKLDCPIISFCPGLNRLLTPGKDDGSIDPTDREVLSSLLDHLDLSSVRGDVDRALLDQIQPGKTVRLVDPALFLSLERPANFSPRINDGTLYVGLNIAFHGPNTSRTMPDRVRVVAAAARELARRQSCRFFYFVHFDSEFFVPRLLRRQGVPVTVISAPPAEMLAWYGELDLHICQMLHSSILSLNSGVPTINLGYDVKNAAFFNVMGLTEYCLPGFDTDAARLTTVIETLLTRRTELIHHIASRKAELRRELDDFLTAATRLVPDLVKAPDLRQPERIGGTP
jgi:lipopolysaccharide exporter